MRLVATLAATSMLALSVAAYAAPKNAVQLAPVKDPVSFSQAERDYDGVFAGRPAIERVRIPGGLFTSRPQNDLAPQSLLAKQVVVDIRTDVPTLADLQTVLDVQRVPMTIDWRSLQAGSEDKGNVGSFTAASKYQKIANCVKGGGGVQNSGGYGGNGGYGSMGGYGGVGGMNSGNYGGSGYNGSGSGGNGSGSGNCDVEIKGAVEDEKGRDGGANSSRDPIEQASANAQEASNSNQKLTDKGSGMVAGRQMPRFFDRPLPFRYFKGTVGELLRRLESTGNIAVWYDGGLVVGDVRRYSVAVLQNQDIVQSIVNELIRLGAKDVVGSVGAGQVFYSAPPRTNGEIIEPYLRRLQGNLSEVTLQVALVTVNMTRNAERGFDWSAFNFGYNANVTSGPSQNTTTTDSSGNTVSGTASGSNRLGNGAFTLSSSAFNANLGDIFGAGKIASVAGAIKFLSRLGNTSVAQNVEMRTLSGAPVILRSGEEIPYVSGVGSVSTGGSFGGALGNSQTARLGTGLTMNVDPRYDAASGIVTMDIGMKLVDLVEMVQLNAGNQLGTLTQPRTREQGLNSILRLSAGQTAILGGIRRDLASDSRTGPLGLFGIGSRDRERQVFWLFAIVRPVVRVYETADAPIATRSTLDTRTTVNPYDEGSYGEANPAEPVSSISADPRAQSAPRNVVVSGATTSVQVVRKEIPQPEPVNAKPAKVKSAARRAPVAAVSQAPAASGSIPAADVVPALAPTPLSAAPQVKEQPRSFIRPMTEAEKKGN